MTRSETSVVRRYDDIAGRYEARWADYVAATARETVAEIDPCPQGRLLDVGCGSGVLVERLRETCAGVRSVGLDLSSRMLGLARHRLGPRAPLVRGDAASLPFRTGSFDCVVSVSSLHYWPAPDQAIAELARVLRPDGRLVITDWCRDFWTTRLTDAYLRLRGGGYQRCYRAGTLVSFLEAVGLTVELRRYRVGRWWGMMTATATRP